jgi:hypothetical protein
MKIQLTRQQWILTGLLVLLTGIVIHYFWARWGLITVHSKDMPLSKVIRSIEKQGHVTIKTNIDPNKPVFMNVDYVTLNEAMETLSTVMDARWRLTYVLGPDKATVSAALTGFESGNRDEGWKHLYIPLGGFGGDNTVELADPRKDPWVVKPASEANLQAYLEQAARNVSASFWVQDAYNPAVKSAPRGGAITSSLSRLASASKSKYSEVILLQGSNRQADKGDRGERDRGDGGPRFAGNFGGDRRGFGSSAMDERLQNEINKMTGDQRAAAEAERDRRKRLLEDMKDLTPEQRQARFQDLMNNPEMQDKMEAAQNQRNNRNSPDQRISRGNNYVSRMAAAHAAAGK